MGLNQLCNESNVVMFGKLNILKKRNMVRLWEAATDLVNLNTWFSWQSSITPLDSLPLAVGKVQGLDIG